mmetsp:Transcript_60537/g.146253  ORF Transcript_60537/g.146253 Transcript_60537/m.146253 type:complete len:468 (+) Transcript_60537:73-1476(+)
MERLPPRAVLCWASRRVALLTAALVAAHPARAAESGVCGSTYCPRRSAQRQHGQLLDDHLAALQYQLEVGNSSEAFPAATSALELQPGVHPVTNISELGLGKLWLGLHKLSPQLPKEQPVAGGAGHVPIPTKHVLDTQEIFGNSMELCTRIQTQLQKVYGERCHTNKPVVCVWGDTDYCPVGSWNKTSPGAVDICSRVSKLTWSPLMFRPNYTVRGAHCGYVMENWFLTFDSYKCDIRAFFPFDFKVSCNMSLTPLGILVLVVFWFTMAAIVLVFLYLCCMRHGKGINVFCTRIWLVPETICARIFQGSSKLLESAQAQPVQSPQEQSMEDSVQRAQPHPLLTAAQRGDASAVARALQAGARADVRSRSNATPLISAAQFGHYQIVESLLQAGAEPNHCTDAGNTAVLLAAIRGHLEVVRLLVRWGADTRKSNDQGWRAIDVPGVRNMVDHGVPQPLRLATGTASAS